MKFDGVIFDLDGTLLDTIADLTDAVNAAMDKLGLDRLSVDEVKERVGNGFRILLERCIPDDIRTEELVNTAYEAFTDKYAECYADKTVIYKGVRELVERLKEAGVRMAVNTNKRTDYAEKLMNKHFPDAGFVKILGEGCGYPKKPEPDGALYLAELMECDCSRVVYIGDSQTDVATGRNAGMTVIGAAWGFRGRKILSECKADYIADTPEEIFDIIN